MTNWAQKHAQEWEAKAIEKCRNDPRVAAAGLCPVCMIPSPCQCERNQMILEMRKYHDEFQRNPVSRTGSWGVKIDVLMEELYKIATKRHEELLRDAKSKRV